MNTSNNIQPLRGSKLVLVTFMLSIATFMQMLDSTISNVAIPTISGDLGASTNEGTWVITSFSVANAITIPITGRLAERFGELKLFLFAIGLFVFASLCCGLSSDIDILILFRVVQGGAAGPLIPLSQSLLLRNYPPEKRNIALACWSMTIIVAPIFGPIMGGYICDNWNWGWIYFINVPIGIIVILTIRILLKGRETKISKVKINFLSLTLLALGVSCLQIMLDKGKDLDWFDSDFIVTLAVISALSLVTYVFLEITGDKPIMDLKIFKSRNFTVGIICISGAYIIYTGTIVMTPQLLQTVYNYTSLWAGLAYSPVGIMPLILAPIIGKFGDRIGMRRLVTFSFIVYAICFYWRATTFNTEIDFIGIVNPQFIQGIAVACFFLPLTTISLSGLSADKFAMATSMSNFFRTLSGSIGTALVMTIWSRRETFHHSRLVESITVFSKPTDDYYMKLKGFGLDNKQIASYIDDLITQQSLQMASNDIFYLAMGIFLALTLLVWFARPPFTTAQPGIK